MWDGNCPGGWRTTCAYCVCLCAGKDGMEGGHGKRGLPGGRETSVLRRRQWENRRWLCVRARDGGGGPAELRGCCELSVADASSYRSRCWCSWWRTRLRLFLCTMSCLSVSDRFETK